MTRIRLLLALLLGITLTTDVRAQFFPTPIFAVPVVVPNGIDFQYRSRHLRINGFIATGGASAGFVPITPFGVGPTILTQPLYPYSIYGGYYPYGPYGAVSRNVTVQVITPTIVVQGRRGYDLSGIDLDVESPTKIWGEKPGLAKAGPKPAKPVEIVKQAPPQEKKPPIVPAPPPPKPAPQPEGERLIELGIKAFQAEEYGLALKHFRQAEDAEPPGPRALFLQGQAYLATGKYHEAAAAIQRGLKQNPNWHNSGFQPKVELFGKNDDVWKDSLARLQKAHKEQPKDADFLFLLGYLSWFDGQRDGALEYFQQARALATDPQFSDVFLKAAKKG